MPFDYKKEYKEFYLPKDKPIIVDLPKINYIVVRGKGNPNDEDSEYKKSIGLLYGIIYTIKMCHKANHQINGYFEFVVPPLEGLWWQEGSTTLDYQRKEDMQFISMIRLPDFVTKDDFLWAIHQATVKKKTDFSKVEFFTYDEGVCVECMHIGSYDDEPKTILKLKEFAFEKGYEINIETNRYHHEIYLSDPRRCKVENLKTVIRLPIKKSERKN